MTTTVTQPEISRNAALPEPLRSVVNGISPGVPAMERKPIQVRREKSAPRHPLYEIRDRANQLERDIIGSKTDDTEALLANVLTLTTLVRGLIVVAIAEMEAPRG